MASKVEVLERGVTGTQATIEHMWKLVVAGRLDPSFQKMATWIRLQVPGDTKGNTKATADAIFRFIKTHAVFQYDPFQIEKIEHPIEAMRPVIEARQAGIYHGPALFVGDCDTLSGVLLATLGGIVGFQTAFETAKVDPTRPDEFSHIWTSFLIGNEWYPLDPSTTGSYPGWRPSVPPALFRRWIEPSFDEVPRMSGLGAQEYIPEGYFAQPAAPYGETNPYVPEVHPGELEQLIPDDSMSTSQGAPADRPTLIDKGGKYFPNYVDNRGKPRVLVDRNYYNDNSIYKRGVVLDNTLRRNVATYVKSQPSEAPITDMTEAMGPIVPFTRRNGMPVFLKPGSDMIVMQPQITPAGLGQNDTAAAADLSTAATDLSAPVPAPAALAPSSGADLSQAVVSIGPTPGTPAAQAQSPAQQQANANNSQAATSLWGSIAGVVSNVAKAAAPAISAKYASAIQRAAAALSGQPVSVTTRAGLLGGAILSSPWVWLLGLGGIGYYFYSKGGKGGFRRRGTARRQKTRRYYRNPYSRRRHRRHRRHAA